MIVFTLLASVSGVAQRTSLSSPQEIVIHGALAHEVGYEDSTTDGHHFCHVLQPKIIFFQQANRFADL